MKFLLILILLFVVASRFKRWLRTTETPPKRVMKTVKAEPLPELDYQRKQR